MMSRRLRRFAGFALALFTAACVVAELEHHDIACHLKTPQHCTACAATPVGADPDAPSALDRLALADAGDPVVQLPVLTGVLLPIRCAGRAPPRSV